MGRHKEQGPGQAVSLGDCARVADSVTGSSIDILRTFSKQNFIMFREVNLCLLKASTARMRPQDAREDHILH